MCPRNFVRTEQRFLVGSLLGLYVALGCGLPFSIVIDTHFEGLRVRPKELQVSSARLSVV